MARKLTPEERAMWERVIERTTRPRHPHRVSKTRPDAEAPAAPAPTDTPPVPAFRIGQSATGPTETHDLAPGPAERLSQAPLRMDARAFERMRRGRLVPEARIDLHGLTLAEAHPRLVSFILSSHAAERRLVLVITGKGRGGREEDGPIPVRRGALRAQVPNWLRGSLLGPLVLQIAPAHPRHGGGGAYYVYLRRKRG